MSVDVIRSDDSIRDVENIARYYMEQKTPATALKFARAVEKTLNLLAMFPQNGLSLGIEGAATPRRALSKCNQVQKLLDLLPIDRARIVCGANH